MVSKMTKQSVRANRWLQKPKRYLQILGPGLTTGASDDDPSGIATYSQAGAQYGFQLLWLSAVTLPLMALVQEMCARIGLVTGRGLGANIRSRFSSRLMRVTALVLFAANTFNIGADLGAMVKGVQLLWPDGNFALLVIVFAAVSFGLQAFMPYAKYARYLKWLAMVLLAYILSAFLAHLPWQKIAFHTLVPQLSFKKDQMLLICAILGTTISPYLFFWQSSQEVEEDIDKGKATVAARRGASPQAMRQMKIDVWTGMSVSNIVMFFIIATCGGVLFAHGVIQIQTAAQAAEALRPFAGSGATLLFALGVIGTGLLALPVLAGSSAYALAESFRWREGLYRKLKDAWAFYVVIGLSMLVGLGINFIGINPIRALIYSAVANGVVAPLLLALIVIISSDKNVMGKWTNQRYKTILGWITTGVMALSGIAAVLSLIFNLGGQ
jgi:NRAMP (natural resistance-associated macrophage protein)-like metal ion transporter